MKQPNLKEERKLWRRGYKRVICLDESGRGPLAGPVVAAAVSIMNNTSAYNRMLNAGVNDSKKLTEKKREELYKFLTRHPAIEWGTARVSEKVIDRINIKNAAELAMEKALEKLRKKSRRQKAKTDFLIIDGKYLKNQKLKSLNHKLIVKADQKVFSCAAASILAKVERDRIIGKYHRKYPKYGFNLHKGYPTKLHLKILKRYGACPIHRKSFFPVRLVLK